MQILKMVLLKLKHESQFPYDSTSVSSFSQYSAVSFYSVVNIDQSFPSELSSHFITFPEMICMIVLFCRVSLPACSVFLTLSRRVSHMVLLVLLFLMFSLCFPLSSCDHNCQFLQDGEFDTGYVYLSFSSQTFFSTCIHFPKAMSQILV